MRRKSLVRFQRPDDREDFHEDARERLAASDDEPGDVMEAIGDYDTNPFLLTQAAAPEEVPVVASEGSKEAEQAAAAALRHLPQGLLNTGGREAVERKSRWRPLESGPERDTVRCCKAIHTIPTIPIILLSYAHYYRHTQVR